jgi:hypothetical protein
MILSKRQSLSLVVLTIAVSLAQRLSALEQPSFDLIDEIGRLEIRRYQSTTMARTLVAGEFDEVGNQGFRRLADYIFGGNVRDQKIAMTAPVGMTASSEPTQANSYWITFSMPATYSLDELPTPRDSRVEIIGESEKFVAVIKYKGNWSEKKYRFHETKLLELLEQSSAWARNSEVTWSRYNPPFIPGFMKTNEVSVEVIPSRIDTE